MQPVFIKAHGLQAIARFSPRRQTGSAVIVALDVAPPPDRPLRT
jgi:hypothetical protein